MNCKLFLNCCWTAVKEMYKDYKAYNSAMHILHKSKYYVHVNREHAEWINYIAERTIISLEDANDLYELAHVVLGLSKEDVVRLYPNDGTSLYDFKQSLLRGEYV